MLDEYEHAKGKKDPGAFTGKSMGAGGSEGREAATGRGGVFVLLEYLKTKDLLDKPFTVALQGFGNVGYFFASVLQQECPNAKLIAVANSKHTWLNPAGIDVTKTTTGTDYPRPEELADTQQAQVLAPEAIIGVQVDVLVLAALEDAVTSANVDSVQARTILELANGPVDNAAEPVLHGKKVAVLPDVIANAGGVIVSYLEWKQNLAGEHWTEDVVNTRLAEQIVPAAREMFKRAEQKSIPYKQAAFELALQRLLS
jgi:glutamate dehydrogenase/leucine dehydrogenase